MDDHRGAKDHQDPLGSLTHAAGSSHLICSITSHGSGCRSFGEDEEDLIVKLHALLGDRWSLIAGRLPGRTDSEVKDYWDSCIKGKLIKMGIDPENHRLSRKPIQPVEDSGDTDDQVPDIAPDLSMNHQLYLEPVQPVEDSGDINQVSNVAPDLRLGQNMNMTVPSLSPGIHESDKKKVYQHVEPKYKQDTESGSSPTLLLFK